ncbi:MAG: divergent PAP2 family protein [Patescibacteria group bacterium]
MYSILLAPLVAGFLAQVIKFVIRSNQQKFSFKNLLAYSGMPSGHTAMVVSLATITGLESGFHSALFAITFILAVIVIRDALGIRRYLGRHGRTINLLVEDLREDKMLDEQYPHLLERIGHTPAQVLVGGILGLAISTIIFLVM